MPHVLVIDDDEQLRGMLRAMLDRAGYEVSVAGDGRQGLKTLETKRVDVVITDIVMPDMEGLEVIMALRRKYSDMKIIAISGGGRNDPHGYLNVATALGANSTLTKPFSREELLSALKELTR